MTTLPWISHARSRRFRTLSATTQGLGLFWGARFMGSIVDTPHVQLLAPHEMSPKECLEIFRDSGNNFQRVWDEASRRVKPLNREKETLMRATLIGVTTGLLSLASRSGHNAAPSPDLTLRGW